MIAAQTQAEADLTRVIRDLRLHSNSYGHSIPPTTRVLMEEAAAALAARCAFPAETVADGAREEMIYRLGVQDACAMIAPPEDMEDAELTQYGKDKRRVVEWAKSELTSPSSGWRSDAARAALAGAPPETGDRT